MLLILLKLKISHIPRSISYPKISAGREVQLLHLGPMGEYVFIFGDKNLWICEFMETLGLVYRQKSMSHPFGRKMMMPFVGDQTTHTPGERPGPRLCVFWGQVFTLLTKLIYEHKGSSRGCGCGERGAGRVWGGQSMILQWLFSLSVSCPRFYCLTSSPPPGLWSLIHRDTEGPLLLQVAGTPVGTPPSLIWWI